MIKKKIMIDFLVIIAALSIFIIWHRNQNKDNMITSNNLDAYQVYLITMDKQDEHWYHIDRGAADMAMLTGVTYFWEAPEKKDTEKQIEILNNIVERGANVVMIAANDPVRLSSAIEDAKANGVKIIYVDSPANEEAIITLATDNYAAGMEAGEAMIAQLEEKGTTDGSIGILGVNTTTVSTLDRERGFRDTIELDGRFTLLETLYMNGNPLSTQAAAINLINDNENLVGLFGTNEGSTEGVGHAIKNTNSEIVGVGFDRSEEILKLIRDGSLKAVMVQNAYTMGYLGMAQAVAAIRGYDTGPDYLDTGVSLITRFSRIRQ